MTDTLTDRERELVEAAQKLLDWANRGMIPVHRTFAALRAYDPPKVKKCRLPPWEEVVTFPYQLYGAELNAGRVRLELIECYRAIRKALTTEE